MTHQTTIDGLKSKHAIVTKVCRANRGVEGAIDEALARLRAAYLSSAAAPANVNANFHLVLTVDRWSEGTGLETPADDICPTTGQPHRMPKGQVCLYCHIGNLARRKTRCPHGVSELNHCNTCD